MATKKGKKIGYILGKCVGPVLLTLLGVLLVFFPDSGSATVATVLGWVLAAAGIVLVIVCGAGAEFFGVAAGVVATACGIYVIRHPLALATVLGYCLGVYLAVQGVSTLYDALRLHKAQHEYGREILLGIIMLSGGILLLCFPLTSSRVVMMVLGVALAVIGVLQLVLRIRERQFPELHTGRPDIIDADE